jgi:4-amino-4-deoxy-L-arabinose transferase-like glycosyltransferase
MTVSAGDPEAQVTHPTKWPPGFHTCLAVAFLVAGRSESTAFATNAIWGAVGVFAAWYFARMLSFSASASLLAATIIGLWPLHLRLSGGASLEPGAAALILLAAGTLLGYLRARTNAILWASGALLGLAGMFRLEAVIAAAIVPLVVAVCEWRANKDLPTVTMTQCVGLGFLLLPVLLYFLSGYKAYQSFRSGIEQVPVLGGLSFWLGGGLMPYSYTVLMIVGGVYLARRRIGILIACCLSIVGMMLVYSLYIRVDASLGDLQRFQLLCAPALVGLGAASFQWVQELKGKVRWSRGLLILLLIIGLAQSLPQVQRPFNPDFEKRYRFILETSPILPKDAEYFSAVPVVLSTTLGVRCHPHFLLLGTGMDSKGDSSEAKIYYHDSYRSFPDPVAERIRRAHKLTAIAEHRDSLGFVAFYRIGLNDSP